MTFPYHRALRVTAIVSIAAILPAMARPPQPLSDTTLPNGLRVLISEDHSAPVFSVAVTYDVGSRNERRGRTGFAHLFEHMMFKGSENVGPGEHPYLMIMNGGIQNGTTNKDRTVYYETLPANQLDLALFLEADRMKSLAITKENLDNQRNAVQEERRLVLDNQPYGKVYELLPELAYENFAYEHSVIGSMADLSAATVQDVADFFRMYYAPNNAILSIVGDVDTRTTIDKIKKYFGHIERQPAPPPVEMTEPAQTEERRATVEDALARLPRVDMAYHIPSSASPDFDALSVLGTVLSGGRSGRFYETVVRQKQLAASAFIGFTEARGPSLLTIIATPTTSASVADLEAALDAEIERVKTGEIADWEIEKARTAARRQDNLQSNSLNRAVFFAENAMFFNEPDRGTKRTARIAKVTAADIQRVAKQYLVRTNRTVVITMPKRAAGTGGL